MGKPLYKIRLTSLLKIGQIAEPLPEPPTVTANGALFFYSPYIKAPGWTSVLKEVSIKGVSSKDFKFYKYN